MVFSDRTEAGKLLAKQLTKYRGQAVVFALPRGGVAVGAEVANELQAPLDMILVRKIGHPSWEEYAICAVAEGGDPVCNESELVYIDKGWFADAVQKAKTEIERRRREYFPRNYQPPSVANKVAIIVDDGIATGLTTMAAVEALRKRNPQKIVVAVPVAPADTIEDLKEAVDEIIVLEDPRNFAGSVGAHYQVFPQLEDADVIEFLKKTSNK